ncbi:unnamed protein product [Pleuronectes platessa]|uniref:Uncharacterized protein n=1 Tax=Pleuronectes platessa TaxID=8262 RepID=A0A9N7VPE4_PLEPL|nr:unnamed protein product [Pleuronectes platessa]
MCLNICLSAEHLFLQHVYGLNGGQSCEECLGTEHRNAQSTVCAAGDSAQDGSLSWSHAESKYSQLAQQALDGDAHRGTPDRGGGGTLMALNCAALQVAVTQCEKKKTADMKPQSMNLNPLPASRHIRKPKASQLKWTRRIESS